MIPDEEFVSMLKSRYSSMHPLVLHRSVERASDSRELFEILESLPKPPFSWDEPSRRWKKNADIAAKKKLKKMLSKK